MPAPSTPFNFRKKRASDHPSSPDEFGRNVVAPRPRKDKYSLTSSSRLLCLDKKAGDKTEVLFHPSSIVSFFFEIQLLRIKTRDTKCIAQFFFLIFKKSTTKKAHSNRIESKKAERKTLCGHRRKEERKILCIYVYIYI